MKPSAIFRKLALLLATLVAVAAVLLFTLDLGFLQGTVEKQVKQLTGRDLTINKGLSISLGRDLVIRARDVHLSNPDWAEEDSFANIFNLHVVIDTWSLWKGPVLIRQLEIDDLTVKLLQNENEQVNWAFEGMAATAAEPAESLPFLLESVSVHDAYIDFNSPRLDQPVVAIIDRFEQSNPDGQSVQAVAQGSLGGRPMQVELSIGPRERLLQGHDVTLGVDGSFGNISLAGNVEFENLWQPARPLVDLELTGPDFRELTDMLGIEGLGSGAMALSVNSERNESFETKVKGSLGEINLDIHAGVESLLSLSSVSIEAEINGPNFGRLARLTGNEGWPEKPFEITTRMQRSGQALEVEQFGLLLAGATIELKGDVPGFPELAGSELSLRINGNDLAPFSAVTGLQDLPPGAFSLAGDINTNAEGLTRLDMEYEIPVVKGRVEGTIGNGEGMTGSAFSVSAAGGNARALGEMVGVEGLAEGSWSLLVDAAINDPAFYDLAGMTLTMPGIALDLNGKVGTATLDRDTDLEVSLQGDHLSDFQGLAGPDLALPDQPFTFAGRIAAVPGAWKLSGIRGNAGTTNFGLEGKLGKGESLAGSDLALEITGTDLGRIFELPGAARSPEGPFSVTGQLGIEDSRLKMTALRARAGTLSVDLDADVPWPLDMSRGQFVLRANGVNITRILPELAGLELDSKDFDVVAEGNWLDGKISIAKGNARIGESTLSATGTLDLPPNLSATDFRMVVRSPDLSRLGTIDGARWGTVPLELVSSFAGTRHRLTMDNFTAKLGESKIDGDFSIDFEGDVPRFETTFSSNAINLKPFQVDPVVDDDPAEEKDSDGRLIPDTAFPMEWLKQVEGRFTIHADRVLLKRMTLQKSRLDGEIRDGSLHVNEIATDGYRGQLVSSLKLEPVAEGGASLAVSMHAEELIMNLTQQSTQDKEVLPAFNIDIDLASTGPGLREAARALNGSVRINSPGGLVKNVTSESASALFLAEIVSAISPSASKQEVINISCVAASIDFVDGMVLLDPGIAMQSDKLNIFAAGKINLDTEKIDINFRTETRKAADIAASELFSPYVKMSGTLGKPSVALDPKGTLLSGGAAYLSGGLSILAKKALGQLSGTRDPCADYLDKASPAEEKPGG